MWPRRRASLTLCRVRRRDLPPRRDSWWYVASVALSGICPPHRHPGSAAAEYDRTNLRAFAALVNMSKPLLAAIHGFCVGGGCALALTADMRYAADDAIFAIPAARLGLGYSAAGLEMLVHVVGFAAAKEIFFTARR